MSIVVASQTDVTPESALAACGYPSTALGALQKAAGWLFLTRRYLATLTPEQIARKALGRNGAQRFETERAR